MLFLKMLAYSNLTVKMAQKPPDSPTKDNSNLKISSFLAKNTNSTITKIINLSGFRLNVVLSLSLYGDAF